MLGLIVLANSMRNCYSSGGRVIRLLIQAYDEKPFLFSHLAALTAKSENKKTFSTSEKAQITRLPG